MSCLRSSLKNVTIRLVRNKRLLDDQAKRENYLATLPPDERQEAYFLWPDRKIHDTVKIQRERTESERAPMPKRIKLDAETLKRLSDPWNLDKHSPGVVERFPALKQRNFYIIQLHHATAKHYDIRLQCSESHVSDQPCILCGGAVHHSKDGRVPGKRCLYS